MKYRNGFVSNSSSSSFIVAFPKIIATKEELKTMLGFDGFSGSFGICDDDTVSMEYVVDRVFKDKTVIDPVKAILSYFECIYTSAVDKLIDDFCRKHGYSHYWGLPEDLHSELQKQRNVLQKSILSDFFNSNPNSVFYTFVYADEDGEGALEHGDIFRNLPHLILSHH